MGSKQAQNIKSILSVLFILTIIPISLSCHNRPPAPEHLRIIFTSDTQGFFTPCGCAGGPRGGMARRATVIEEARESAPGEVIVVETGNFSSGMITDFERMKTGYIVDAMDRIGYDAVNVGFMDARRPREGVHTYNREHAPLVSAGYTYINDDTQERTFSYPKRVIVDKNGFKIGIMGHPMDDLDPEQEGFQNDPDVAMPELYDIIKNIYTVDRVHMLIVISEMSQQREDAKFLVAKFPTISVLIGGSSAPPDMTEEVFGSDVPNPLIIPKAASWGRSVGILDLELSRLGGITGYQLQYVDLNDTVEDDPSMAELTDRFLADAENSSGSTQQIQLTGYVGSLSCKECHGGEYEQWAETRHSQAWNTLQEVSALNNPSCIPCHSTGYSTLEAIPSRLVSTKGRDVGCEECHGPGEVHIEYQKHLIYGELTGEDRSGIGDDPIILNPPEDTCIRCHIPPNDEAWVYSLKYNRILHN